MEDVEEGRKGRAVVTFRLQDFSTVDRDQAEYKEQRIGLPPRNMTTAAHIYRQLLREVSRSVSK